MRSLAYCTSGYNANNTHNVCVSGVCKVCKSTKLTHKSATSLKSAKLVDPIRMKMPHFRPLCLIILLWQEFKEKLTFLNDTA